MTAPEHLTPPTMQKIHLGLGSRGMGDLVSDLLFPLHTALCFQNDGLTKSDLLFTSCLASRINALSDKKRKIKKKNEKGHCEWDSEYFTNRKFVIG